MMFVNGFLSPWGFAGLNMPFQMVGMALIGLAGGFYRKIPYRCYSGNFYFEIAVLGAFLTALYDLITNLGVAASHVITGIPFDLAVIIALAYGTPFTIVHVLSNTAVFGVAFLPIVKVAKNMFAGENIG
ncbi:MAG: hypothetical protein QW717_00170 [Candidatus Bathyarchaeia archaeon]